MAVLAVQEPVLGAFSFYSGKASRLQQANQGRCVAYMFIMHVAEELQIWPEGEKRTRIWVPPLSSPSPLPS